MKKFLKFGIQIFIQVTYHQVSLALSDKAFIVTQTTILIQTRIVIGADIVRIPDSRPFNSDWEEKDSDDKEKKHETQEINSTPTPLQMEYMNPSDNDLPPNVDLNQENHDLLTPAVDPQRIDQAPDLDQIASIQQNWDTKAGNEQIHVKHHKRVKRRKGKTIEEVKRVTEKLTIKFPKPPFKWDFDSIMNLFSKWIELKNDNHKEPYSTLITNSEIQRLLENKAMEIDPEEKRMNTKADVLIISFARKIADFPLIIRNTFYKKFMYTNKNPYRLIWLYCDLFFKFFVFYYDVSFPAKWDLDDNKTMELLKLFFDFCILIMTKKQFELILKLFKDDKFLKFNCLSKKT